MYIVYDAYTLSCICIEVHKRYCMVLCPEWKGGRCGVLTHHMNARWND